MSIITHEYLYRHIFPIIENDFKIPGNSFLTLQINSLALENLQQYLVLIFPFFFSIYK